MLPIAIDLNVNVVPIFFCVLMAGLNSPTDTKILRKIKYIEVADATNLKRVIG